MSSSSRHRTSDVTSHTDSLDTRWPSDSNDPQLRDAEDGTRTRAVEVEHTFVKNPDASTRTKTVIECDGSCGVPDCDELRVVPETW